MENFKHKFIFSLLLVFLASGFSSQAQEYSFGLKGGLNYSMDKIATEILERPTRILKYVEPGMGFQGGVFFEYGINKFFIRPEVLYVNSTGNFNFPSSSFKYTVNKISVPILLGYNLWGPVDIYAGPAYQNILNHKIEIYDGPLEQQQSNWAGHIGVKYAFKKLEIDLRYDFTLDSEKNQTLKIPGMAPTSPGQPNVMIDDGRLNQIMLSLSFKLFGSENPWRRSRGRGCYF